jgi:hypothetical protein
MEHGLVQLHREHVSIQMAIVMLQTDTLMDYPQTFLRYTQTIGLIEMGMASLIPLKIQMITG